MRDMADFCAHHKDRLQESSTTRYIAEALIVRTVINTHRISLVTDCWACPLTEAEFVDVLRESGLLGAKADAYGGRLTTQDFIISSGGTPTSDD